MQNNSQRAARRLPGFLAPFATALISRPSRASSVRIGPLMLGLIQNDGAGSISSRARHTAHAPLLLVRGIAKSPNLALVLTPALLNLNIKLKVDAGVENAL